MAYMQAKMRRYYIAAAVPTWECSVTCSVKMQGCYAWPQHRILILWETQGLGSARRWVVDCLKMALCGPYGSVVQERWLFWNKISSHGCVRLRCDVCTAENGLAMYGLKMLVVLKEMLLLCILKSGIVQIAVHDVILYKRFSISNLTNPQ